MYCVLLDIPAFRQYAKTQPEFSRKTFVDLQRNALDTGGIIHEVHPGRWLVLYRNSRPGDSRFMLDAFCRYEDILQKQVEYIMGYTILMEVIGDKQEALEILEATLIQIREQTGAFIGDVLASQLSSCAILEKSGKVWRIQQRLNDQENPESGIIGKIEKTLPASLCAERITGLLSQGTGILFIDSERPSDIGSLVDRSLARVLGKRNDKNVLWIRGNGRDDNPALALVRHIPAGLLDSVLGNIPVESRAVWDQKLQFLETGLQGAWKKINNRSAYRGMYFSIANLSRIWDILLRAFWDYCKDNSFPCIIFVENADQLPGESLMVLIAALSRMDYCHEGSGVLIVSQPGDDFRTLRWGSRKELLHIPRFSLSSGRSYFESFRSNTGYGLFDAGTVSILSWLQDNNVLSELGVSQDQLNENAIHDHLFQILDHLDLEVYYLLTLLQGLLPLHKISDFLISFGYERIRLPAIFERLYGYGLTRGEEQTLAIYLHEPEMVAAHLPDSGKDIREALAHFIISAVHNGDTCLSHDLFHIVTEILDHKDFLTFTFPFAERLLDTRSFVDCDNVIGFLSARSGAIKDLGLKDEYLGIISYLNCRSLLLKGKMQELKGSMVHLEQMRGISPLLTAYVSLQVARWYYVLADLEPSLSMIKSAIMGFQEQQNSRGLSAAQVLIGLILLARERMVEARDYFVLARNTASNAGVLHEEMRSAYFDALVMSIQGYYSRVLGALNDPHGITEMVLDHGILEMAGVLKIVKARIYFELGNYDQAAVLFSEAIDDLPVQENRTLPRSAEAWLKRCQYFLGNDVESHVSHGQMEPESVYFETERLLRESRYDEVLDLIGQLRYPLEYETNLDDYCSKTCFGLLDSILFAGKSKSITLQHLLDTNHALALSGKGEHERAATMMFEKTRSKNLSVADPYLYFYYYAYSRILRAYGTNKLDDAATILGKSVKFFQERGSRIEDPSQKQQFFRQAHWNRQLLSDARGHNLA